MRASLALMALLLLALPFDSQSTSWNTTTWSTMRLSMRMLKNCVDSDCRSNRIFSPLSIASTLTMLMAGVDKNSNSYSQLRSALNYAEAPEEAIEGTFRYQMDRIEDFNTNPRPGLVLQSANALFSVDAPFSRAYVTKCQESYRAQVRQLSPNTGSMADQINNWVANRTRGRITNMLSTLPPDAKMVAANAVYFNANWEEPFEKEITSLQPFTVSATETVQVQMMSSNSKVGYIEDRDLNVKMVAIPYKGREMGMFMVMPMEGTGIEALSELEGRLTPESIRSLMENMKPRTISLQLPRFRIHKRLNLKRALKSLGIVDLFEPETAALSRMTRASNVALNDIVHQAFIDVSETGTEAAAATVLTLNRDGSSKRFRADKPFLFFVVDTDTKAFVFSGRFVKPAADVLRATG